MEEKGGETQDGLLRTTTGGGWSDGGVSRACLVSSPHEAVGRVWVGGAASRVCIDEICVCDQETGVACCLLCVQTGLDPLVCPTMRPTASSRLLRVASHRRPSGLLVLLCFRPRFVLDPSGCDLFCDCLLLLINGATDTINGAVVVESEMPCPATQSWRRAKEMAGPSHPMAVS